MEIKNYLDIIRRWWWAAALCTLLATGAGYILAASAERVYEARARYLVGPVISSSDTNSDDLRVSLQAGQTYRDIVGSRLVIDQTLERLGLPESAAIDLRERVAADWNSNAQVLTLRARAGDPAEAARIVDTLGATLIALGPSAPDSLSSAARERVREQIAALEAQEQEVMEAIENLTLAIQSETSLETQRVRIVALDQRRDQLADIQRDLTGLYRLDQSRIKNQLTLLDPAIPPIEPIEPDAERIVLSALLGGLALGAAAVLILAFLDTTLRSPTELTTATGLRYLGGMGRGRKGREALLAEQARTIAFGLETLPDPAHTLLITGPGRAEGRSSTSLQLGAALAALGRKVILVDVDLHGRGLSRLLARSGLKPAGQVTLPAGADPKGEGLTLMQIGANPNLQAVQIADVAPHARPGAGLRLPDGWIAALRERADYVIFDADQASAPDVLALSRQAKGTLLVAASGKTKREDATRAVASLQVAGARIVGAVLNGLTSRSPYDYAPAAEPATPAAPAAPTWHVVATSNGNGHHPAEQEELAEALALGDSRSRGRRGTRRVDG